MRSALPLTQVALLALAMAGPAAAGPELSATGPMTTVFRYASDRCADDDVPDAPARAFRDAQGRVRLFAPHYLNRGFVGDTPTRLRHDCRVAYRGAGDEDPEALDDRGWLASFHTADGKKVYAIVHNEYHGHLRPGRCPSGQYGRCWYNSLVLAVSRDGGETFTRRPGRAAVVLAPQTPYVPDAGKKIGPSNPSNVLALDGFYYFLFVDDRPAEGGLVCLARSSSLAEAGSWKVWDGAGFSGKPCRHLRPLLPGSVGSLVRHEASGAFIVTQTAGGGADRPAGIYYSTSDDLVRWSAPRLLLAAKTYRVECGDAASFGYPALVDPSSRSRNFDTVSDLPLLFLVRRNVSSCRVSLDRDLVTMPVQVR